MTLILSFLCPDYIIQVSDRRLTQVTNTGKVKIVDDNRNKLILHYNRIAYGYTGLAKIGNEYTDEWLANTIFSLHEKSGYPDIYNIIAQKATDRFGGLTHHYQMLHTFVSVGWASAINPQIDAPDFIPVIYKISNSSIENGRTIINKQFNVKHEIIPSDTWQLFYDGDIPNKKLQEEAKTIINRIVKRGSTPQAIVDAMIWIVRQKSNNSPYVGKDCLVVSIPRHVLKNPSEEFSVLTGPKLNWDTIEFRYFAYNSDTGILYAPIFIGDIMYSNMSFTPMNEISPDLLNKIRSLDPNFDPLSNNDKTN